MNRKIIERKYRYKIPTPKELFERFKVEFLDGTPPDSWNADKRWTDFMLGIFDSIGRSFRYKTRPRPGHGEYLNLDQIWDIRHTDTEAIVLALEHENTSDVRVVLDDELQKLIDVKAYLKVLIFYPYKVPVMPDDSGLAYTEIQEKIRSAQIKNSDEKYVIISIVYTIEDVIEVSACSLDSDGKAEDLGSFQVKYPP